MDRIGLHFWYRLPLAIAWLAVSVAVSQAAVDCDQVLKQPDYVAADLEAPMRFFFPDKQGCTGNAVNYPYLAVGKITDATPAAFAEFSKKNPPESPIEFVSPGGSLLPALQLGELIRAGKYDTSLGELCASACAYAIMGGVNRYIAQREFSADWDYDNRNIGAEGTKFGIHQFYQSASLDEPTKKAFSAIDKSGDQIAMAILLEYTLRMGGDVRLVQAASAIPPWQGLRWLTQEEMIAWKVDNTHRLYTGLSFHSFGRAGSYIEVGSTKGAAESYLRIFCKNNVKEPLFTFIFMIDQTITRNGPGAISDPIAAAKEYVTNLLSGMNIVLSTETSPLTGEFQIQDVQGFAEKDGVIRIFAALRPIGFNRQNADKLTRVALQDNGNLARSEWTFQDFAKFNIHGDRKLISLAMRNCID